MKACKLFLVIVVFLFTASCQSSMDTGNRVSKESPYERIPSEEAGLSIKLDQKIYSPSVEQIKLEIGNKGKETYTFSSGYSVEKKAEAGWQVIPFKEGTLFEDSITELPPSHEYEVIATVDVLEPQLSAGIYRLIKDFEKEGNNEPVVLAAEFEIN